MISVFIANSKLQSKKHISEKIMADDAKKDEGDKSNENNKKQNPDITPLEKQPQWIQLQEKAKQRAIQFTHDPNLDQFAKDFIIASLAENTLRAYAFDAKIF